MDVDNLLRGQSYAELKESYVIFICTQDPFGKGLPVYTFRSVCGEDGSILLNDKSVKVFYFIFHLTFHFIVCIFTVILAGFFLLRYAMPVRGVFLLYTPYCQVFPKGSRVIGNSAKQSRKRDSLCGAGPQIRNCGKEQVGVLPNIFPSCFFKAQSRATQTVIQRMHNSVCAAVHAL